MTAGGALRDGIRRVNRAPVILACTLLVTVLAALPPALLLRETLRAHLGSSLAAEGAAAGANYEWWTEFAAQSRGLGSTFTTTVIGFAAVLDNLSAFIENDTRPAVLLWLAGAYLTVWLFLSGGIVDRLARNRPTRSHEFFTACGVYFVRFLRLAPIVAATYYLLLAYVHPWLFDDLYDRLTRDVTVERTAFFLRVGLYALFGLLFVVVNVIFDYAKVRAVVEDRRSMGGAVIAGVRFVWRNAGSVFALHGLVTLLFAIVLTIYGFVAPGAGSAGWQMWLGLVIGQLYVLARLWVRLVFLASETALFQGRLAHAGYVAAPIVRPLVSPAVEQIVG